jgi:site-specific DNA-methyltransferase (adenine-specific)
MSLKNNTQPIFSTDLGELYQGDCLEIMPKLKKGSIDCFFADPPFNLKKDYGSNVSDDLDEASYIAWCEKWINEGIQLLKPGGSFFIYNIPKWNALLSRHLSKKLTFRNWIAIEITFSLPISGRLYPSHYSLLYFVKGPKPNTFSPARLPILTCRHCGGEIKDYGGYKSKMNPSGVSMSDVWTDIPPVRHKKYKNREANALSLKLMNRIIEMATKPGDVVFDPFGGSGTTYAAAELNERKWIGVEISTTKAIVNRFKDLSPDQKNIEQIKQNQNTLFTEGALKLRKKCGHDNSKYRQIG